ncbi:MAG: MATE family efflux transporter [Lachnospiraceae bacterium]|nr:MATE family efflux transporter [Lachnospiraceae bacterium]
MNRKTYEMDMVNGPILFKMIAFAVPLMLSSILQLLFNAADVVVVGKFAGDNALAAVGSNGSLINLLTNFFIGLSIGSNVIVSNYFGAKKEKEAEEAVHTSMFVSLLSGVLLTILGLVAAPQILKLMNVPENILPLSVLYIRIYFGGITASMIYNFGSAILRAVGDTRRPLYYLSAAGVLNVILNLIFVIVFDMSVAGVALATVISQCLSAFLIVRCLMREKGMVHLDLAKIKLHPDKFLQILQIGIPASLQGIVFSLSNVIIQASVNSFGEIVVAGNSAASNIEGFVYVAMNAFYQSNLSFTSQNMGAGRYDRITRILITAQACVIVTGLVLGNLAVYFGPQLLSIYTDSAAVIQAGLNRLDVIARWYFLCGIMDVMVGSMRGMGHSVEPMVTSLLGACGLRLLFIFTIFGWPEFHTIHALYMTYPISWIVTFLGHIACFFVIRSKVFRKVGYWRS